MFLAKWDLKIRSKFTGENLCWSAISIELICNFIEIALWYGCCPVNLLHIFRTSSLKNTSARLVFWIDSLSYSRNLKRKKLFLVSLHKKWSFPLRLFSVNMNKSTISCGFGHIYWRNPSWKTSFFAVNLANLTRSTVLFSSAAFENLLA